MKTASTTVFGTYHDDDDVDDDDDDDDALSCQFKFTANCNHAYNIAQGTSSCDNSVNNQTTDRYSLMKHELERLMKEQEEQFKLRHKYSELVRQVERKQLCAEERERLFDNAVIDDNDDDESDYDYNSDSDDEDDDDDVLNDDVYDCYGHDDCEGLQVDDSSPPHGIDLGSDMNVSLPRTSLATLSSSMYSSKAVSDWAPASACAPTSATAMATKRASAAGQLWLTRSKPIPIPYSRSGATCRMRSGNLCAAAPSTAMCYSYQLTPHAAAHRVAGL